MEESFLIHASIVIGK